MVKERFLNKTWVKPTFQHNQLSSCGQLVSYPENLELADYVDIGNFVYINARHGVIIEEDVEIASHCAIYSASTIDNKEGKVVLKKNCKVGSHSVIMPGITIGENSVVGAFSFVNKNIPPNVTAIGIPVKIIKKIKSK